MIFKEYTVTVKGNEATINEPVYLYKYDRNVELRFNVGSVGYKYTKSDTDNIITQTGASYCQIRFINEESQTRYLFDICPTVDGQAVLLVKGELIDEEVEIGVYDFQIRLLDEDRNSIVSLPPIRYAIHIERPLFDEGDSTADLSAVETDTAAYTDTSLDTYNPDGTYNQTNWKSGDIITSAKLNKLEQVAKDNVDKVNELNTQYKDIENEQRKNGFINFDYFYFGSGNDDDRLGKAFEFCKNNKITLVINRKVILTEPILSYDFSFSIVGNGTSSELFLESDSVIDVFFDITAQTGVVMNTEIKNITINANKKANICTLLRKGRANRFSNVTIKYALDKDFQIGFNAENKVIELNCDKLYCIGGEQADGSPMSNYNLYIQGGSSDNNFIDVTCMNASEANVLEEGWSNSWTNIHCYGYPYSQAAKSNFYINGQFSSYDNIQCDTFTKQAIFIQGHYLAFNNIKIQTTLDLYPDAGGINIYSQNSNSSNLAFNNIMFKKFRPTDTQKYPFDIKFNGSMPRTINIKNVINDLVPYQNRITNTYKQSVNLSAGTTSFKVTLPYELENNNYIIVYNADFDCGKILITSKGTKDIWFSLEKNEYGGFFSFILNYQLNN